MNGNAITGPIPIEVTQLQDLGTFYMDGCQFTGSIPKEFGNLPHLSRIYLSWNQLTGIVPPELGNLQDLAFLGLSKNQLVGPIPSELDRCTKLTDLYLDDNALDPGPIPEWIRNHPDMGALGLDRTGRTGEIPPWLTELPHLYYIKLAGNDLVGTIPSGFGNITGLMNLRLGDNHLTGTVPADIGNLTHLWGLDLSANALFGELPGSFINLTGLNSGSGLDLRYNGLFTEDPALKSFLDTKQDGGGDWLGTQTLVATNFAVSNVTQTSAHFAWTPMTYTQETGGYQIVAMVNGSDYQPLFSVQSKVATSLDGTTLQPSTEYRFAVRSFTDASPHNRNRVFSDRGADVPVTTPGPPVVNGLNPSSGPTWGNTPIAIGGVNLLGTTIVRFGTLDALSFAVDSATQITAVNPAQGAGILDVTVTNPDGTSATGHASKFTYRPCEISCDASAPDSGKVGDLLTFQAQAQPTDCQGSVTFQWTFGDGATSTEQNPSHGYAASGNYDWILTATADGISCSQNGSVSILPCQVTCDASAPGSGKAGDLLTFQAQAQLTDCQGAATFQWAFGDGSASTEQNPQHAYATSGKYDWTLTATADGVSCTKAGSMAISPALPGDCDGDGQVSIGEVQKAINMFLDLLSAGCGVDCNGDGTVSIGEVQKVINGFLGLTSGC
jgi:PKD repeat protein